MSGLAKVEMSGFRLATMPLERMGGGYCGKKGHYRNERQGSKEATCYRQARRKEDKADSRS